MIRGEVYVAAGDHDRIAGSEGGNGQVFGIRLADVEDDDLGGVGQGGALAAEFGQSGLAQFAATSFALQIGEEIYFMLGNARIFALRLGKQLPDGRQYAGQIGRRMSGLQGFDFADDLGMFEGRLADYDPGRRGHQNEREYVALRAAFDNLPGELPGLFKAALVGGFIIHGQRAVHDKHAVRGSAAGGSQARALPI